MTEEQIRRAREIIIQAESYKKNQLDASKLKELSSEQLDLLSQGQDIDIEEVTESNTLRR